MDSRTGLPVVGMVGGGQLARMTHQAAIALGQSLHVLAVAPDDGAALVAADVQYGDHTDLAALRTFAKGCDVVTFDHEHVPTEHIRTLAAEGDPLPAGGRAAARPGQAGHAGTPGRAGRPNPTWRPVSEPADLVGFGEQVGWPVVLKAARGGYDGRGVWMVDDAVQATELARTLLAGGTRLIVEERVPLRRELAVQVARSPFGQVAAYPVVETVQQDGINVEVLAPAPGLDEELAVAAQQLAIDLATALGVVGLLAVELFEVRDKAGRPAIVVNELAMRPHNSGHWTIEGPGPPSSSSTCGRCWTTRWATPGWRRRSW
ncbi:hypothetical protein GCM10027614_37490 [Micromonospora vulcania]